MTMMDPCRVTTNIFKLLIVTSLLTFQNLQIENKPSTGLEIKISVIAFEIAHIVNWHNCAED